MEITSSPPGGSDASSDSSLPARIGNYRVLRRLATGGTSDVLLARAEGPRASEGMVVLKLMLQEHREDPSFEKMFASEAAAYSRLSHPAIVQLYDFFGDGEQPVMVLEYVDGMPLHKLRALLKRGKFLDDAAAMFVAWRIFGALGAAHTAKDPRTGEPAPVIHRDVNPSNVLIPWDGQVKIADFGIAKVAGMDNDKTQAGFIKGTYGYMAPEQVRGVEVTERADVYAASLLLWELLVGRKAIVRGGTSDMDVLRAMAEPAFPSLAALRPELPLEVLDAVSRGLEPDPANRTVTADELAGILRISCNLEDGRQRLVDALGGVRPVQRPDELAVTVSRPPRPSVDASADATIPNLVALVDDSQSLPPLPPLSSPSPITTTPPPPAAAPLVRKPTLPLTSRPSTAPRPTSNAPLPNVSGANSGSRIGAATLMGITPGQTPPPPPPEAKSVPPPPAPVRTPSPPPAGVFTRAPVPGPQPPARPVTQPLPTVLPTVVIAQTPAAMPVAKALAVTMPLKTPSAPPPPPQTVRTPPPPPPVGSVPPGQIATVPGSFVVSPLAATGPMPQTPGPSYAPPAQVQVHAVMPVAWTPPPPPPAPSVGMPTYPDAAHTALAARRTGRIVAAVAAIVTLLVGVLVIAWERGRTPSAYVPPAPGSPAASVIASSAPATPSAAVTPPVAPSPSVAAATPPPSSAPAATTSPSAVALAPGMGTITVTPAQSGHRIWVDTHIVGESPGTFTVRCGWRSVMVGSDGWRHNVNIPCGGDIVIH